MKFLFRTLRTRPTSVTPVSLLTHRGSAVNPLTIATKVQRPSHCQTMSGCSGCSACSSVATFFLNLESIATSHEKVIHPVDGSAFRVRSLFMWYTISPHLQISSSQIASSMSSLLLTPKQQDELNAIPHEQQVANSIKAIEDLLDECAKAHKANDTDAASEWAYCAYLAEQGLKDLDYLAWEAWDAKRK